VHHSIGSLFVHAISVSYEVVACIAGRGFKVRRNDMRRLLPATDGKVFTLQTIEHLVVCTRIRGFVTRG
jgi:hypothetical protein